MTLKIQTENKIVKMDLVIPYKKDCKWRVAIWILNGYLIQII